MTDLDLPAVTVGDDEVVDDALVRYFDGQGKGIGAGLGAAHQERTSWLGREDLHANVPASVKNI